MSKKIDQKTACRAWLRKGIEHIYFAFRVDSKDWSYRSYFNILGLELICKACILSGRSKEYESLNSQQAKLTINKILKGFGHNFTEILGDVNALVGGNEIDSIKNHVFSNFTGQQFISIFSDALEEIRYLVPTLTAEKFPLTEKKGAYWDPLGSSALRDFVYAVSRVILRYLKNTFQIGFSVDEFQSFVDDDDEGRRFRIIFFASEPERYLI